MAKASPKINTVPRSLSDKKVREGQSNPGVVTNTSSYHNTEGDQITESRQIGVFFGELSPNPDGSAYIKQVVVNTLNDVVFPEENVLYIVGDLKYKWYAAPVIKAGTDEVLIPAGFSRVEDDPALLKVDGGRETPNKVVTRAQSRPVVFNDPVAFNKDITYKGVNLDDLLGGGDEENVPVIYEYDLSTQPKLTQEIFNNTKTGDIFVFYTPLNGWQGSYIVYKNSNNLEGFCIKGQGAEIVTRSFLWYVDSKLQTIFENSLVKTDYLQTNYYTKTEIDEEILGMINTAR